MRSLKMLTSAIETILDISRLDSGQLALQTCEFSIGEMMEDINHLMAADAREKSLYFRLTVDSKLPEYVLGDSTRLQQILLGIVVNAIKFTETGGVEIHVSGKKPIINNTVTLVFEVRDTGIGISEEQQKELYKPLYTVDSAYTRKQGGIGMGLAVSYGLTMLMGGKITCESTPGQGSVFTLVIPMALPEKKTGSEDTAKGTFDLESLRGMKVLVAEDNDINQMIIEELLDSAGIEISIANNGIEALELLQRNSFDAVLMDIQMPEMDGLTAAAQIRSDSRFNELPILAMTANAMPEHVAESLAAGLNDHLTKPIDVDQLYFALKKWGKR
jgi:CheY-like chemotaxis protein